ncbi:hypothetical protein GUJ93_ZPchr0001g32503 [Zizania palustris]|uniref:RRM domain-containing protein n=1 Tax=Zizania palustris TaxID=103762 RepID=A0A8J5RN99_ZIZPA|nr:hypothetical protein GUJ93_ZPchr0001g32503 [Zizania palustris]
MSLSHHLPPQGDPYYVYAPHPHPDPQRQGVLTLFVAGLPDDVKPREIHNLFSRRENRHNSLFFQPGEVRLVDPASIPQYKQPASTDFKCAVAFVSFFTHQTASLSAMAALNGTAFDPETGDCLHIELAKSNSRKRHGGGGIYRVIDKRINRKEGNVDHENTGDEGDDDAWGEDDGGVNDGNSHFLVP